MAFKKMQSIEQDRYSGFLRLENDGDSVTGVFLYKSYDDVLVAESHYVKSNDYSGYVHCCGSGCPACRKGLRVRNKLFIPFLVLADLNAGYEEDTVVFWDRNVSFNHQLKKDVFNQYPNPSELVFRITRRGAYRDINTTYSMQPVMNYKDNVDEVLSNMGVNLPDYYETVVKSVDIPTLSDWMDNKESSYQSDFSLESPGYTYKATPRKRMPDPEYDSAVSDGAVSCNDSSESDDFPGRDFSEGDELPWSSSESESDDEEPNF